VQTRRLSSVRYSYAGQVAWIRHWVEALDVREITLVCQDWGSLIGLRVAAEMRERFARILLANGGLPTDQTRINSAFKIWRAFSRHSPVFPIGWIVQRGTRHWLSRAERTACDAPFPSAQYKAAARAYPSLVPVSNYSPVGSADNHRAWTVFEQRTKPFICCFSDGDPITRGLDREFLQRVPGTKGQPHTTLRGGHFLQEDDAQRFAQLIVQACGR
jgi:haloalkane dehalogenase